MMTAAQARGDTSAPMGGNDAGGRGGEPRRARRGGFTLVELLVVLIIIGTIMSLLLPSLASTRTSSKKITSLSLMNNLSQATSQFITDKQTAPGFFSAADMGSPLNWNGTSGSGLAAMQNVMIDLAGGVTTQTDDGVNILKVGPANNNTVNINLQQIGAPSSDASGGVSRGYFNPDKAYFQTVKTTPAPTQALNNALLPVLIDSFGQPILAWSQDERGQAVVQWAAMDSTTIARYYWASNGVYLSSTSLARAQKIQAWGGQDNFNLPCSMLGAGGAQSFSKDAIQSTIMAITGHPAFPSTSGQTLLGGEFAQSTYPLPAAARGAVVYHSAGANGLYVGSNERGGIGAIADNGPKPIKGVKYNGSSDPMIDFDDIVIAAGN